MISVVIPVYNQADKIGACFDSILSQSVLNNGKLEVIVVNDGSRDNIAAAIDKYQPLFQTVGVGFKFITQENRGANAARNAGAKNARGGYVIFCDADISMERGMLKKMLAALKNNPSAGYAYSSFLWGRKAFKLCPFDAQKLKEMPYIHTTSLIRCSDFLGFDESIKRFQDWDLWLTMLLQGHAGVWVPEILFKVETGGTMSAWLPSFAYRLMPFLPAVKKYNKSVMIIKEKHKL